MPLPSSALRQVLGNRDASEDEQVRELALCLMPWWYGPEGPNPAAARMYGYSSEEIIGQPVRFLTPVDRAE